MILSSNSIIYIIFAILLQILVGVKSQTTFNPELRRAHTATFINDKLYILGGVVPASDPPKSPKEIFLYLDVSVPFNTNEVKWNGLSASTNNIVPSHLQAAAIKGGANNDTL